MLRRLTVGLGLIAVAITIAACSSNDINPISVGPTFKTASLYATNASQNAVSIYPAGTKSGSGPQYQIGGSSTTIAGPQYLAFDTLSDLYISNYSQTSGAAAIVELKALATGNVIPLNRTIAGVTQPRGLALFTTGYPDPLLAVANINPSAGAGLTSQLVIYDAVTLGVIETLAGPLTGLNGPTGVASDSSNILYIANLQGASVEGFNIAPSPSPSPSGSPVPTPTPTATPTVNPSASPTATPTAVPTFVPVDLAPTFTISGSQTGLVAPVGVSVDSAKSIYVADQGNPGAGMPPAIRVYAANPSGASNVAPIRTIVGSATLLNAPNDVKIDASGLIYVSDSTPAGGGVINVYPANANGNVAPVTTYTSPGAVIGIALVP